VNYHRPVNDIALSPTKPILAVALAASATMPAALVAILRTDTGQNTWREHDQSAILMQART
jgi:hypothetical protein